jgi:hypothetical protein
MSFYDEILMIRDENRPSWTTRLFVVILGSTDTDCEEIQEIDQLHLNLINAINSLILLQLISDVHFQSYNL